MTAQRDVTRIVRSWLGEDEHESADAILGIVLSRLDTTPQRRSPWPSRRFAPMSTPIRVAVAAAAILIVAVVGYNLLPGNGGLGGQPTPTPIVTPTANPSAAAVKTAASATVPPEPPAGPLALGRHRLTLEGVPFTFNIATTGWTSNGAFGFDKAPIRGPAGASFIYWERDADGIFSDPCGEVKAPPAGPSAADIAQAIAAVPGTVLVSGPFAVTVGGMPAQTVVVRMPVELPCPPDHFFLWYDDTLPDNVRYATDAGSTIQVWIVEVDGKRVQLDGEWYKGASFAVAAELQAIIDSIQFE